MFLLPGIIIVMYVTKTPIPPEWKVEIARYLANMQRDAGPDDQGWGMYVTVGACFRPEACLLTPNPPAPRTATLKRNRPCSEPG